MSTSTVHTKTTSLRFGSVSLPGVAAVMLIRDDSSEFVVDGRHYPVVLTIPINLSYLSSSDVASLTDLSPGTRGTITVVQTNADGVSVEWTIVNAVFQNTDLREAWRRFATVTVTFLAYAGDGVTMPVSFTRSCRALATPEDPHSVANGNHERTESASLLRATAPDALVIPETMEQGDAPYERIGSILAIAEPLLGVDRTRGERAYIRYQGEGRLFVTRDPHDTIYFPFNTEFEGCQRYVWVDAPDGIWHGCLRPMPTPSD